MKILYVENHAVFARNVVDQFLSQHEVVLVPSLAAARHARAVGTFDVMLVDYDLDDGKGDAVIREVRAAGDKIPIIGVSAREEGNAVLLEAGASAICPKMEFEGIEGVILRIERERI